MKQFLLFLIVVLYSSFSFANSCNITDENRKGWSEKYSDKVKITVDEYESEFFVSVIFPTHIDSERLQRAFFLKGNNWGKPELQIPAETRFDNNKVFVWFSIHPSLAIDTYVSASYGESCGVEIVYKVEYNKLFKQDK
jgi:hypothetical protein